ncbi:TetR family transcriptional regulator [Pseudonocardia xinjiangensis]|uniref:TetR family transcriptional regulator n=1 Tax=Pseudonocardia xinjiangensis TaxID=75289 RepID=UPI003D8A5048
MTADAQPPSPRREELLELAYRYALSHGLAGMSLRPLAEAIGSSPRVLLYLFGSKDGLVQALLARSRREEVALLAEAGSTDRPADAVRRLWDWLADPAHRDLLRLWTEGYARSLVEPDGPWGGFAARSVEDWLDVLRTVLGPDRSAATAVLAVLRGALLDLLASGDVDRTTAAVHRQLALLGS